MRNQLFCYGTLCIAEIMRRVSGTVPPAAAASLDDYVCHALAGLAYPGIVPHKGAQVSGVLYSGLSRAQLVKLDAYEGEQYLRRRVWVSPAAGSPMQVWTYVLNPRYYHRLSPANWSLEQFKRDHLQLYLSHSHNKIHGMHGRDAH